MDEIDEAIAKHKKDCQELQNEKFSNMENTLKRLEDSINILIKQSSYNLVLTERVRTLEDIIKKRPDRTIAIISFGMSLLVTLYLVIPKIAK